MGPRKNDHASDTRQLLARITELEDQIQHLKLSLSAHTARLAAALDTLDLLRVQHAEELAEETRNAERLRDALGRYRDVARAAEAERDNLRDAVVELAERVESSRGDLADIVRPSIRIPNLLHSLHPAPAGTLSASAAEDTDHNRDLWSYAAAMITSLRTALASEQRAHAETRRTARAQIVLLEARIARRDAEIATNNTLGAYDHAGTSAEATGVLGSNPTRRRPLSPQTPGQGEVEARLVHTETQNARLAAEVGILEARLEEMRRRDARGAAPDERHTRPRSRSRSRSHSTGAQRRRRSPSPPPPPPNKQPETEPDPDRTIRPHSRVHSTQADERVLNGFERDIAELGRQIDALRIARGRRRARAGTPVEEEEEQDSEQEGARAQNDAAVEELRAQIDALRVAPTSRNLVDAGPSRTGSGDGGRRPGREQQQHHHGRNPEISDSDAEAPPDAQTQVALAREIASLGAQVEALRLAREGARSPQNDTHSQPQPQRNPHPPLYSIPTSSRTPALPGPGAAEAEADEGSSVAPALTREIAQLGTQVDALRAERARLWTQIDTAKREGEGDADVDRRAVPEWTAAGDEGFRSRPSSSAGSPLPPRVRPRAAPRPPTPGPSHRQRPLDDDSDAESAMPPISDPPVISHPPDDAVPAAMSSHPRSRSSTPAAASSSSAIPTPPSSSILTPNSYHAPEPQLPTPTPPQPQLHPFDASDSDGERSMELATPLIPSVILPSMAQISSLDLNLNSNSFPTPAFTFAAPVPIHASAPVVMNPTVAAESELGLGLLPTAGPSPTLSVVLPLPPSPAALPGDRTGDGDGTQAVRELLDFASARDRGGHGGS